MSEHTNQPAPPPLPEGEPGSTWVGPIWLGSEWCAWNVGAAVAAEYHLHEGEWSKCDPSDAGWPLAPVLRHAAQLQRERDALRTELDRWAHRSGEPPRVSLRAHEELAVRLREVLHERDEARATIEEGNRDYLALRARRRRMSNQWNSINIIEPPSGVPLLIFYTCGTTGRAWRNNGFWMHEYHSTGSPELWKLDDVRCPECGRKR